MRWMHARARHPCAVAREVAGAFEQFWRRAPAGFPGLPGTGPRWFDHVCWRDSDHLAVRRTSTLRCDIVHGRRGRWIGKRGPPQRLLVARRSAGSGGGGDIDVRLSLATAISENRSRCWMTFRSGWSLV